MEVQFVLLDKSEDAPRSFADIEVPRAGDLVWAFDGWREVESFGWVYKSDEPIVFVMLGDRSKL